MIMRTVEAAKLLHVTARRLIACKKEMGYKPLEKIDSRDLKKIRKHLGIVRKNNGKRTRDYTIPYEQALKEIANKGYITRYELLRLFETKSMTTIEEYFEYRKNGLYDEQQILTPAEMKEIKWARKTTTVYKLREVVFSKWREENRQNGKYNNSFQGMMIGRNCG